MAEVPHKLASHKTCQAHRSLLEDDPPAGPLCTAIIFWWERYLQASPYSPRVVSKRRTLVANSKAVSPTWGMLKGDIGCHFLGDPKQKHRFSFRFPHKTQQTGVPSTAAHP